MVAYEAWGDRKLQPAFPHGIVAPKTLLTTSVGAMELLFPGSFLSYLLVTDR
jgi:hypothetical protein